MTLENRSFRPGTTSGNDLKRGGRVVPSGGAGEGDGNDLEPSFSLGHPGTTDRNDLGAGSSEQASVTANVYGGSADPNRGNWCTPKWVAELIGPWDLDPCSNPRSHIATGRTFSLEAGQDGLALANAVSARTRAFINPPYEGGSVLRWIRAYAHTRFCFLLRFDPSTKWFAELYDVCELVAIPRGRRINFEPPPGVKASSQTFPHALFYRRYADATPAVLRACISWRPYVSAT